ncbi:molecular chaperone DnaK [Candidatus Poribacteria bacterium]|nr:molecular chaperone DnaK [Candidatus Poribacteria bacterium]
MNPESKIIGIDLGTTNSVVAIVLGTEPEVIPNTEGGNKTPSVVAFLDNGEVVVGEIARRQAATNPTRTISSIKRLMGRTFQDFEEGGELFPYEIVSHDGELLIDIEGMGYRPEQVSALILKKMKESAEAYLGEEVTQAVITVPAYFDDMQRQATIEAAEMAGLSVMRLLNEPTAAAMAYGLGRSTETDEIVAVYDFGGGTFDIAILEITGKTFEVMTSTGDSRLGGDDLDNAIVELVVGEFLDKHGVDLTKDPVTLRRLKEVAERAKCELSTTHQAVMTLPFITYKDGQPLHLERMLNRREFEELIDDFVRRTIRCCKRALEEVSIAKRDIAKIILVGGTTRIPLVQDSVEDFFDQKAFKGVNPDEVVAIGAATQAGVFEGNVQEVILLDVTPHSLGIEVEGGKCSRIIDKNSTIPIKAAKTFTTTEANQEFVNIHVLQGESSEASENRSLGKFSLSNIPPSPPGAPRIRVTFFINADGVMEISAEDMSTGAAEAITIVHSHLSEEENKRRRKKPARRTGRGAGGTKRRPDSTGGAGGPRREPAPPTRRPETQTREGRALPVAQDRARTTPMPVPRPPAQPPEPDPSQSSEHHDRFAVLGDTRPGEMRSGIQARPHVGASLDPVDYSKAPPMYSHMADAPRVRAEAEAAKPAPAPVPSAEALKQEIETPPEPSRKQAGTDPRKTRPTGGSQETVRQRDEETLLDRSGPGLHDSPTPQESPLGLETSRDEEPAVSFPPAVAEALNLADAAADDTRSFQVYARALEVLNSPPYSQAESPDVLRARALMHMQLGQIEETRSVLRALREKFGGGPRGAEILALHERALTRFGATSLLRDRGMMKEVTGDLMGASTDFEQAARQEPEDSDRDYLERLYRKRMQVSPDPAAQFRLVKLLLKSNRVDEAIDVLQILQKHENYETRALKILGLCHWQKNMHYLAWQKFKALPMDDDMQDILYRLACDMEAADQLQNAVGVLEHLIASSAGYRDAEARLRKIMYRLKLQ